jgi:DNA mismatch repair protein MutS
VPELERARFEQLRGRSPTSAPRLSKLAGALADLDALASFAEVAHRHDYVRPTVDDGAVIDLVDARHPVVETMLEPGAFVPNDVTLDSRARGCCW